MVGCIFCDIVDGTEPASIIHQDACCLVLMDVYPIARGHVLVIPRRHAVHLHELPEAERWHLFHLGCRVLEAQRACGLPWDGANVFLNDGPVAGQHVPHVHLHLLPRRRGDRFGVTTRFLARLIGVFGLRHPRSALDTLAERLRSHLAVPAIGRDVAEP